MTGTTVFDRDSSVHSAWDASFLGGILRSELTPSVLFEGAIDRVLPAGHTLRTGESPAVGLVVEGMLRVFFVHSSGRQSTMHYLRPGSLWGYISILNEVDPHMRRSTYQALAPSRVIVLDGERFASVARKDADLAWALAKQVASFTSVMSSELYFSTFSSMSERVAQHMTRLATEADDGIFVSISHQELADAVGSVREVVTRIIAQFKDQGLVRYSGRRLEIVDWCALKAIAADD